MAFAGEELAWWQKYDAPGVLGAKHLSAAKSLQSLNSAFESLCWELVASLLGRGGCCARLFTFRLMPV